MFIESEAMRWLLVARIDAGKQRSASEMGHKSWVTSRWFAHVDHSDYSNRGSLMRDSVIPSKPSKLDVPDPA